MTDVWFVVAGWGVITLGMGLYAFTLLRRLRSARDRSLRIRRDAERGMPIEGRE